MKGKKLLKISASVFIVFVIAIATASIWFPFKTVLLDASLLAVYSIGPILIVYYLSFLKDGILGFFELAQWIFIEILVPSTIIFCVVLVFALSISPLAGIIVGVLLIWKKSWESL